MDENYLHFYHHPFNFALFTSSIRNFAKESTDPVFFSYLQWEYEEEMERAEITRNHRKSISGSFCLYVRNLLVFFFPLP
ncbi:MAG TPA: hypothetical protein DEF30_00065 [Proteiniclasticum sp.]|nr:hypothetical protein [Proteiniclasticum sp.]